MSKKGEGVSMTINFYDARLKDDKTTVIVKEKTIDYDKNIRTDNPVILQN